MHICINILYNVHVLCIVFQGTNLNAVEDSELEITIGDGLCSSIMIHNATVLTCVPPQYGSDTVDITVSS